MALFPGLPGWAGTRKVKPIWILLKQEIVSGSGISWAICKSAPRSRQTTMPAPHHSVFLQARCPSCHPTNSVTALKAKPGQRAVKWVCVPSSVMCIMSKKMHKGDIIALISRFSEHTHLIRLCHWHVHPVFKKTCAATQKCKVSFWIFKKKQVELETTQSIQRE